MKSFLAGVIITLVAVAGGIYYYFSGGSAPVANVLAMYDAAREFGYYPL